MKKIFIAILLFVSFAGLAQKSDYASGTKKYGHCNAAEIAQQLPELTEAEKQFEAKTNELDGRLQRMFQVYQEKVTAFQTAAPNMTEEQQKTAAEEIQNLEVRIGEAQQNSQQELAEYDAQLKAPILEKVKAAIKQVSVDNKYDLIFDLSTGAVLYAGGDDITPLVKAQLGL